MQQSGDLTLEAAFWRRIQRIVCFSKEIAVAGMAPGVVKSSQE